MGLTTHDDHHLPATSLGSEYKAVKNLKASTKYKTYAKIDAIYMTLFIKIDIIPRLTCLISHHHAMFLHHRDRTG
jgi:hypothetical protein